VSLGATTYTIRYVLWTDSNSKNLFIPDLGIV
jgi:hypothetical protein